MEHEVSAVDILSAAVEMERRGHAFYSSLAESAKGLDKKFFAFMAGEEKRHEDMFSRLLHSLAGLAPLEGETGGECSDYMRALLDSQGLFLEEQKEQSRVSPLGQAMQMEKDSILFYMALRDMVPDAEKAAISECIEEEKRHLRMLHERLSFV